MLSLVVLVGVATLSAGSMRAQTPPPVDRPDLSGTWVLDREISVDLARVSLTLASPQNNSRSQGRNRRAGLGGFGGGGFGGSRARNEDSAITLTAQEQARLKAVSDELKAGSATLVISLNDPSFVVNDARNQTQFFQTDGSAVENHVGDATIPSSTHWEGARVVTECALGSQLTLVYTYTLLANSRQLVVRVNRKDGQNVRPFDPDVRLVYKRSQPPASPVPARN
jgi:hypothetical protein